MTPVRWGILGAANFARQHMAPAIHAAEGAELAALATSDPAKAAGFKAFCPSLFVHDSYEALLADPTIEAVYIPLPNHLHVEWTLKAIAAGKHVLTEKPMTLVASDFDQLIAARDKSGLFVAEAYMIVHHPQWHRQSPPKTPHSPISATAPKRGAGLCAISGCIPLAPAVLPPGQSLRICRPVWSWKTVSRFLPKWPRRWRDRWAALPMAR